MRKIDWKELLDWYNDIFKTNIKTAKTMRRACYKRFGSLEEAANKLGISSEALRLKIIEDGGKIVKSGMWKRKKKRKRKKNEYNQYE